MEEERLDARHRMAAGWWTSETESGVTVYPLRAAVEAMANLGCDASKARRLIGTAAAQFEETDLDGLIETIARVNRELAFGVEKVRAGEPESWDAYRELIPPPTSVADETLSYTTYVDCVKGAWLGKLIGTALGDPIEGWTRGEIRAQHGWVDRYLAAPKTENDDTAYPILVLHALDEHGVDFTSEQLAFEWVHHLPFAYTAEQAALENIQAGVMPPESRWRGNPCGAWVGGQMRGEVHGLIAPLLPARAAEFAFRDAVISHYREGLDGEIYAAVLVSRAFSGPAIEDLLRESLADVRPGSALVETVERAMAWCHRYGEWEAVAEAIEREMGAYHWIHTLPNLACVICGLLLGEGDFERTILTTLACGFDTDCSVGQAAALLGTILGASRLPEKWTGPIGEALDTYVIGFEHIAVDALTEWTVKWGKRIAGSRIGRREESAAVHRDAGSDQ
jgi:ADP-ribosylglycohydrolase